MTAWPFTTAELTAGLRRYFAEPTLQVKSLSEHSPAPAGGPMAESGGVRGLHVEYAVGPHTLNVECVLKEPQGVTRAGLAGAGRREVGLYRALAAQLPMATPALIAAHPSGNWLVLEAVEADIAPDAWSAEDYRRAVMMLAELHERFWNLADDLAAYPWLARPLTIDFEIHVYAAAQAVEKIVTDDWPRIITGSQERLAALGEIISEVDRVVQPLRAAPPTLLHGDFSPANVRLQADGEMVVYDWQLAGLGPGVLDLVAFVITSHWEREALPIGDDELIALYRQEMGRRVGLYRSDAEWAELWDHALLWRFTQEVLGWLVRLPRQNFAAAAEARLETLWLKPVLAAAERRLKPIFYR